MTALTIVALVLAVLLLLAACVKYRAACRELREADELWSRSASATLEIAGRLRPMPRPSEPRAEILHTVAVERESPSRTAGDVRPASTFGSRS